jgi:hypothetical protein
MESISLIDLAFLPRVPQFRHHPDAKTVESMGPVGHCAFKIETLFHAYIGYKTPSEPESTPLVFKVFVIHDVVSSPDQCESGMSSTVVTRRKFLSHDTGHFVFLSVLHIVYDSVDARTWHLVARLKFFRHTQSSFLREELDVRP